MNAIHSTTQDLFMVRQAAPSSMTATGEELTRGHKKKARTRQQLLGAALSIYGRKGCGGLALNALAEEAGVSNGTVYNYFRTREEVLEAVGVALVEELSYQVNAISDGVVSGAQRVSIGVRTFVLRAVAGHAWAAAVISVAHSARGMQSALAQYVRADLQAGLNQGEFKYADEEIALSMMVSAIVGAMSAAIEGEVGYHHDSIIAEMILRALGVSAQKACKIANLPMPE